MSAIIMLIEAAPTVAVARKAQLGGLHIPVLVAENIAAALVLLNQGHEVRLLLTNSSIIDKTSPAELEQLADQVPCKLRLGYTLCPQGTTPSPAAQDMLPTILNNPDSSQLAEAVQGIIERHDQDGMAGLSHLGLLGGSDQMQKVFRTIRKLAPSNASVFITGESGTGKELCAEAVHKISRRACKPFIAINCGAIPPDLLESEIFGHLKGSFTGAISNKKGAADVADGGTLFLDEICELDLALQKKLLRFLQNGMVQPVGATKAHPVDIRIICATNRDPWAEVAAGRFREDLIYRLFVLPIHMPPLRERGKDILLLARALLSQIAKEEQSNLSGFTDHAAEALQNYHWPGNVRELENIIRMIAVLYEGKLVKRHMLGGAINDRVDGAPRASEKTVPTHDELRGLIGQPFAVIERRIVEATIEACDGSVPRAAEILELSPSTLYRKREQWENSAR